MLTAHYYNSCTHLTYSWKSSTESLLNRGATILETEKGVYLFVQLIQYLFGLEELAIGR